MTSAHRRSLIAFIAIALTVALAAGAHAQTEWLPEEFTAAGLSADQSASAPSIIEIRITRWTSAGTEASLVQTLLTEGPTALLAALRGTASVGVIKSPGSLPWNLRLALQQRTAGGGRRILILTDRPIGDWEVLLGSPSLEYPFSVIELSFDGDGNGEGTLSVATRITADEDAHAIDIDSYRAMVRLVNVTSRRPT